LRQSSKIRFEFNKLILCHNHCLSTTLVFRIIKVDSKNRSRE
jgi:ribosomal protein S26